MQHQLQFARDLLRALPVRLVEHEHVTDLEQSCLDGLDVIPQPRHHHDDGRMGERDDVDLVLPHAYGLHQQVTFTASSTTRIVG
jgi:hypothetical protein